MTSLSIILEGDGAFSDVEPGQLVEVELRAVAMLESGTTGGRPSCAVRVELPDGRTVIAQTTLALFLSAADAMRARAGDPRHGRP